MKAILLKKYGGVGELYLGEAPTPLIKDEEVLVQVKAAALNRADILQRKGLYPPPPGESDIIGLEVSGEVAAVGKAVTEWAVGDRVFALLAGGGYAAYAKVHKDLLLQIPEKISFEEAAGLAEAFLTAWQAIVWLADLQGGETILVHAGASGVGTAAIQIAALKGADVIVTASAGKHNLCTKLGANHCIDYRLEEFAEKVRQRCPDGVHVVIDFIGAPYFEKNLSVLAADGRMVMLGFLGGTKLESLDLRPVIFKRLKVMGSTLRARSLEYKSALVRDFKKHGLPALAAGKMRPVIDSVFDWQQVQEAHAYMEANQNQGKIVLRIT